MQSVFHTPEAVWHPGGIAHAAGIVRKLGDGESEIVELPAGVIPEPMDPSVQLRAKPAHLNLFQTHLYMESSASEVEQRTFAVALQKKYSTLVLPLVIALFTAPFALSLSRKGKAVTVGLAIGLWLLFIGVGGVFEQFGLNGYLSADYAVWGPLAIFSMFGAVLLSKVRT